MSVIHWKTLFPKNSAAAPTLITRRKSGKSKSPKKKFKLDESLIGELIKRGRPRGFVTDTEILNYFPNIEKDISFLDEIYSRLEKAGIKQDAKGMITVNDRMKTSAKGVYAVGDVTGGRYAHEAMEQGIVAAENALGMGTTMAGKAIPRCIYSMPEIAAVGMTEEEAMKRRSSVLIGSHIHVFGCWHDKRIP